MSSDASERTDIASPEQDEGFDTEFLHELIVDLRAEVDELHDQHEADQEKINTLEARIDELDDRTDIMAFVAEADSLTPKQRRATLLLHLKRKAEDRYRNGKKKSAEVTQELAAEALRYPDIDRTTYYTDFKKIAEWVDNEHVCRYIPDTGGESRLLLDLTNGALLDQELPVDVANEIRGGE